MTIEEAIDQLWSLRKDAQLRAEADPDEEIWRDDVAALDIAIQAMKDKRQHWREVKRMLTKVSLGILLALLLCGVAFAAYAFAWAASDHRGR